MTAPLESDMALLAMVRGKCLVSEITCYWCGSKGYYKSDCPSLRCMQPQCERQGRRMECSEFEEVHGHHDA